MVGEVWGRWVPGALFAASLSLVATEARAERVVYLNLGATTLNADNGQDPTTDSFSSTGFTPGQISGLTLDAEEQAQLLFYLKEASAPFDVEFVFTRPAAGFYDMVVFGSEADAAALFPDNGCSAAIGLGDCGDGSAENISFMFHGCLPASQQGDMRRVAFNALVGLGFGWGLENESSTGQVMGSFSVFGLKFGDSCINISSGTCGDHPECPSGQQNATTDLNTVVGVRVDDGPPLVVITEPADGSTVPAAFGIAADVTDKFGGLSVELTASIMGQDIAQERDEPPYAWDFDGVPAGTWTFNVNVTDADGNAVTESVEVTVDAEIPETTTGGDSTGDDSSPGETTDDPSGSPTSGSASDSNSGDGDETGATSGTPPETGDTGAGPLDPTMQASPEDFGAGGTGCQCTAAGEPEGRGRGWSTALLGLFVLGVTRRRG